MLNVVRHDSAPPLFYLLERLVATLSTSPAALRLVTVLAGTAAIPIMAALGRRVAGDNGGTWAAVIGALAPALVGSSLDARMYILATTLVLASTCACLRALDRPTVLRWALYLALSILAVYTVYFALFALLGQIMAVAILYGRRRFGTAAVVAALGIATVASLTPWILAASAQLSHGAGGFWVPNLSVVSLSGGLAQFFIGAPINRWVPGYGAFLVVEGACIVAGLIGLAAMVINRRMFQASGAHAASLLALSAGVGVGVILLVSFWHPLEDGRYLGTAWAPLYPLVGAGLATLQWRRVAVGAVAVMAAMSLAAFITPPTRTRRRGRRHRTIGGAARPHRGVSERVPAGPLLRQQRHPCTNALHGVGVPVVLGHRRVSRASRAEDDADAVSERAQRVVHRRTRRPVTTGPRWVHRARAITVGRASVSPCSAHQGSAPSGRLPRRSRAGGRALRGFRDFSIRATSCSSRSPSSSAAPSARW